MATTITLTCFALFVGIIHASINDYPEFSWIPPGKNVPKGYREYINQGKDHGHWILTEDKAKEMQDLYKEIKEQAKAVNIEAGIPTTYAHNYTQACWDDWQEYVFALTNPVYVPLWASRMFDSSGFVDPGILDGNVLFEGRYDECRRAQDIPWNPDYDFPVYSMYCIAYWYQTYPNLGWIQRGQGICIPNTCTDEDAMELYRTVFNTGLIWYADLQMRCERGKPDLSEDAAAISTIVLLSLFGALVLVGTIFHWCLLQRNLRKARKAEKNKVKPSFAENGDEVEASESDGDTKLETKEPEPDYDLEHGKTNNGFIAESKENGFALQDIKSPIELNGTTQNTKEGTSNGTAVKMPEEKENRDDKALKTNMLSELLLAFSMYITVPAVTTSKQPPGAYNCLNGLRVLAMLAVILGHTFVLGPFASPGATENTWPLGYLYTQTWFTKITTMDVYVDTFFILSAFLVTISLLKRLEKSDGKLGVKGWVMHFFSRYWRLTPTYMLVLMFTATLWHYLGTGPFMSPYFYDADTCSKTWWANLLYINNLYIEDGVCFGWSWYLAVDWQLYCMAPVFIYVLWRWKWIGIILNVAGFCGGMTATVVLKHKLYTQDDTTEDPIDDFSDIYIKPWCRCPVYFMGIGLGYFFFKTKGKIRMPWWLVCIGWFIAVSMYVLVSYIPVLQSCYESSACGQWNSDEATAFYSLHRIMWGIWVCWLILACSTGYGGFVNSFLSWNFFVPIGKLTYLAYLIHPIFTYAYFFTSPVQQYYTFFFFIYIYAGHVMFVFACALIMSVSVSAPLMGAMAVLLPSMNGKARR